MSTVSDPSSGRKTYSKPACSPKSISEITSLFRQESFNRSGVRRSKSSRDALIGPIVLVPEYSGEASLIEDAVRNCGMDCRLVSLGDETLVLQILRSEDRNSSQFQASLLLFDLRRTNRAGDKILERVSGNLQLKSVPLAILVSLDNFQLGQSFDAHDCWQICGRTGPALLVKALKSFLDLWSHVLKQPSFGGHHFIGAKGRSSILIGEKL